MDGGTTYCDAFYDHITREGAEFADPLPVLHLANLCCKTHPNPSKYGP